VSTWDKYRDAAVRWTDEAYADSATYLARRAELVRTLGPELEPGDTVLDLACGDGALGDFLPEQRYVGVDASDEMVEAGRARGRELVRADLNDYVPDERVASTMIFRAIYYARDRAALLQHIAGYTDKKLVFDLNPRQYAVAEVRAQLREAGFDRLTLHPFFVPQTVGLPPGALYALRSFERAGALARLVLRFRFTYICSAHRSEAPSRIDT
jgi:SAM-dependent methyltransferase